MESIWRKADESRRDLPPRTDGSKAGPQTKRVTDDQGTVYTFDKLLLATGSTPRRLPFGGEQIIYFRTLDDYQRCVASPKQGRRFAVIGGGFIGSEIAAALAMNGKEVVMIFPGEAIGSRMFPPDLAKYVNDFYRQKGVEVLAGKVVAGMETRQGKTVLKIRNAQTKSEREVAAMVSWRESALSLMSS